MNKQNNIDPFKQLVKGKLANYQANVPHDSWDKLESSLFAAQKTKTMRTRWVTSSVAAVAAALIGIFFVFQNLDKEASVKLSDHQATEQPIEPATSAAKESTKPISTEKESKVESSTSSLIADNVSTRYSSKKEVERSNLNNFEDKEPEATPSDKKGATTLFEKEPSHKEVEKESDKLTEIDEETKQKLVDEFIKQGNEPLAFGEAEKRSTKRKGRNSVALAGNSALASSQYSNPMPSTLRTSVSETYGTYTLGKMQAYNEEVEVKPESETTHNQPVSFGLLTSYALTPKLQIETGVVYTYLSSETRSKSSDFQNSEKVQFHYLGVPLNLNYTFMSINKLNMFVTAGAMIEKDIDGKIKYYDEKKIGSLESGYSLNSSSKIKQQNPQFSVAGGVGLTYPIYDKASLFGKVGGRYYIKTNNEYKTYYSDEKFGLDMQLGIKFNF